MNAVEVCQVFLWGQCVGAASWDSRRSLAFFEYDPGFVQAGLPVAPLKMPLNAERSYSFPELSRETYHGLPGLLADSLPDYFGNQVFQANFQSQGRDPASVNPIEKLCYIGKRGMGALEFKPALGKRSRSHQLDVDRLANLADAVLHDRERLESMLPSDSKNLEDLMRVGTSAGGARAKAIIAWNPKTNEIHSGQVKAPAGFEYWIIKLASPKESRAYGRIEYAYFLMAKAAGLEMSDCRLWEHNGLAHFMTKRFDRQENGAKLHVQSLCAIGHYDFNRLGTNAYEDAFRVMRKLKIEAREQLFRRVVFNIAARNQDDHTRNMAFLMDRAGKWSLAPAFDVTWAYNKTNEWTRRHQMGIGGKFDEFTRKDLLTLAKTFDVTGGKAIIEEVLEALRQFPQFAQRAGVPVEEVQRMMKEFRFEIGR